MHQTRIHVLVVLFIAVAGARLDAGSFLPPEPWDVKSPNGKFLVHVEPLKKDWKRDKVISKATAAVFRVGPAGRRSFWKVDLVNDRCPDSAFLSDDGKTLVTVEDWGHDGYGPNTVVFYTRRGLLRRHSLKSALGVKTDNDLSRRLVFLFTSAGYHWRQLSFEFFAAATKAQYFCIWVKYEPHWLCFNMATGKQVKPTGNVLKALTDKAVSLSLKGLESDNRYARAEPIVFLGWLRRGEDRVRLRQQLACPGFNTSRVTRTPPPPIGSTAEDYIKQLARGTTTYEIESHIRGLADLVLARWSGKTRKPIIWWDLDEHFSLGSVGTEIQVPENIRNREGCLYLYLIKPPIRTRAWEKPRPMHVGTINIYKSEDGRAARATYPVLWRHVLPGKYWLRVVWNANAPKHDARPQVKGGPFEGMSTQAFSVKPSCKVQAGKIQLKKMHNKRMHQTPNGAGDP